LNKHLLDSAIQDYIQGNLNADVHTIALAKSPFTAASGKELANQIAAKKKSQRKLPTWFTTPGIYYPPLLSVEQCSSEIAAAYKAGLAIGESLIDITGGYGVDSFYFSKTIKSIIHCEISAELAEIAAYNLPILGAHNINFITGDGLTYLQQSDQHFGTIYIDPARRSSAGKVFMLEDCTPDVISHLDLLLARGSKLMIKTAPLLDISLGLKELRHVAEVHIVSIKNECKELIWILEPNFAGEPKIVATTLNGTQKQFSYYIGEELPAEISGEVWEAQYLYEPDVALLKSGAFNLIAKRYQLQKFHSQTQLYIAATLHTDFPGRIFKINAVSSTGALKKERDLSGSVIVRNYPDKAASLVEKYRIKSDDDQFIVFTQSKAEGKIVIKCTILQHY
jgi:hypothetical protein